MIAAYVVLSVSLRSFLSGLALSWADLV